MSVEWETVEGRVSGHDVRLYALSTCVWCKKTRALLEELGISFRYIYVDLIAKEDRGDTIRGLRSVNPSGNFPTVVIDDIVVVGYKPDRLKEGLGL